MTREQELESLLYDAIVELEYIQCVENCNSGLCATPAGEEIVNKGMKLLRVRDLSGETWATALREPGIGDQRGDE